MLSELLPSLLSKVISRLDYNKITEIRLRRNCPVIINYFGKNMILKTGDNETFYADKEILEYVLRKATENSLYAFNHQIKQGFITARGGIRIGISGESVNSDNFLPKTIKDIYSMNIRIPHEIKGCSNLVFKFIFNGNDVKNTLIVSPPGAGKTTFLRDIARKFSDYEDKIFNVLIVDERFEIASCVEGAPMLDVGKFTDIVSGAGKMFAFTNAVRAMRPDIILTDELSGFDDVRACSEAINSGVKVIATVHANDLNELREREMFRGLLGLRLFERIIILSNDGGPGHCKYIFDEQQNCLYF